MARPAEPVLVEAGGRTLSLSRLEKVFYPATGFTKGEVIDYYARIAPVLLPHLASRPLSLKRYPDGVQGPFFYQKECPSPRPDWVRTWESEETQDERAIRYCVPDDLATLTWLANLANLELHPFLHRIQDAKRPTLVAFDLDPGPGAGLIECARVATRLREWLATVHLDAYPKTSGAKGMQVYVPLNTPATYPETSALARTLAEGLAAAYPQEVTAHMRKDLRRGRVFIDWSQNAEHKTTVCVYSLRAGERPLVSTPLDWNEVKRATVEERPEALQFDPAAVLERVRRFGDRFRPVLTRRQTLPRPRPVRKTRRAAPRGTSGAQRVARARRPQANGRSR